MFMELAQQKAALPVEPEGVYDEELDDIRSIVMDICEALADTNAFDFTVSGFGQSRWPVDVRTDLATVIEQGVERSLEFVPSGLSYDVHCRSRTSWQPHPDVERIDAAVVLAMLVKLQRTFAAIVERLLPKIAAHEWFRRFMPMER
jgi:hypothetical protein